MDDTKETNPHTEPIERETAEVNLDEILERGRLEFLLAQLQSAENDSL